MDSLSQIVLGAAVGEAALGKKVGNKAALWGAIAGTIPDLDVLSGLWQTEFESMVSHRGFSHSIFFSLVFAPILGWLIWRIYKRRQASYRDWSLLAFLSLVTHPLLDCFTSWGTQLFWPFSDHRVAWDTIFVADPLYTLPFLTCLIVALFLRRDSKARRNWNRAGLIISCAYLMLTVVNKMTVNRVFTKQLHAKLSLIHI